MELRAYKLDDELTVDQKCDLDILLSLKSEEDRRNWISAVDELDFYYGMALLKVAQYKEIDRATERGEFLEANEVLKAYINA